MKFNMGSSRFARPMWVRFGGRNVAKLTDGKARLRGKRKRPAFAGLFNKMEWSEWRDSNPRPLVPQTSALTGLRYTPTRVAIAARRRDDNAEISSASRGDEQTFGLAQIR